MESPINDAKSAKLFQQQADALLDVNAPGFFNQAMMELGATVCRPQSPTCLVCPVNAFCEAFRTARQDEFPYRRETKPIPEHHLVVGVIYRDDTVLLTQRQLDGLLGGLWEFPGGDNSLRVRVLRRLVFGISLMSSISLSPTCDISRGLGMPTRISRWLWMYFGAIIRRVRWG